MRNKLPSDTWKHLNHGELARQYSPSSCVDNFDGLIAAYASQSRKSESRTAVLKNLRYGQRADELLDFFPAPQRDSALQVFIHGGYWQELSKNESTFAGARFVENGFAFAAIDYTLAPAATIDDMINQCCASIQWLYQNSEELGFDRHKIFLSGSSAGAHLASMVLLTCWSSYGLPADCIKGVALMSGIYDLRPISHTYINEPLQMDEAKAKELSPLFKDLTAMPPAIICWGEYETDEFKRQSRDFSWALQNSGNKVETFEVAAVNHFDIVHTLAEKDATLGRRVYAQMS